LATIKRFEDLEIWQEAIRLSKIIIEIAKTSDLKSDFKLNSQIKSSAGSVVDNIAEGFERDGNLEFRQFLSIAKGSSGETRSQCYRLFDSEYITEEKLSELTKDYKQLNQKIGNFINYLNKNDFKGNKFKST